MIDRQLRVENRGLFHLDADPAAAALFHRPMAAISYSVAQAVASHNWEMTLPEDPAALP